MARASLPHFLIISIISIIIASTLLCQTRIAYASRLAPIASINATATATVPRNLQCIDSSDWTTSAFQPYDCYSALAFFEDYEVYRHSSTIFEFYAATITPPYPQFAQSTPRKYTYRTCTMAIVMLADLPAGLPGLPARSWTRTDLSDYVSIENAGLNVRDGCLSSVLGKKEEGQGGEGEGEGEAMGKEEEGEGGGKKGGRRRVGFVNPTGYDIAGMNGAIGVFLWDTDSVINRVVRGRVFDGGGGNSSSGSGSSGSGSGGSGGSERKPSGEIETS